FSNRRRHTRSKRDWSSDVCSSDLVMSATVLVKLPLVRATRRAVEQAAVLLPTEVLENAATRAIAAGHCRRQRGEDDHLRIYLNRSEERRVGKEWSSRCCHEQRGRR